MASTRVYIWARGCALSGLQGQSPGREGKQSPPEVEDCFALEREILTKVDTNILRLSSAVGEKFVYAPEHWSGSCWTGCYDPIWSGRPFDGKQVIIF